MTDSTPPPATRIKALRDGPLVVRGSFELIDEDGTALDTGSRPAIKLCRCGRSASQPFCDASHADPPPDAA